MAAEILFVNPYKKKLFDGTIDLANDTIKAMLLTASHSTDIDAHEFADDISANEVSTSGSYTAGFGGRVSLTITNSQDDTDDEGVADLTDFNITNFTGSPAFIAYIKEVTDDTDSPILAIEDLNGAQTSTAGTWSYTTNTEGLFNIA